MPRDRSFIPLARLHFLPRVSERTHGAREHEQAPAECGRKAQFSVNDRRRTVDIHRNAPAFAGRQRVFKRPANGRKATADSAVGGGLVNQSQQAWRAWIDRMKAVPK